MADSPHLLTLPFDQSQRYATVAKVADSLRSYLSKPRLRVPSHYVLLIAPCNSTHSRLAELLAWSA